MWQVDDRSTEYTKAFSANQYFINAGLNSMHLKFRSEDVLHNPRSERGRAAGNFSFALHEASLSEHGSNGGRG